MNKQQLQQELVQITKDYNESLKLAKINDTQANYEYSSNLLKKKQKLERELRGLN